MKVVTLQWNVTTEPLFVQKMYIVKSRETRLNDTKFLFDNGNERKRRKKRRDRRSWWCVGRALNKRASILGLVSQPHLLWGIPHQTRRTSTSQEENTAASALNSSSGLGIKSKLWFPRWCRGKQLRESTPEKSKRYLASPLLGWCMHQH